MSKKAYNDSYSYLNKINSPKDLNNVDSLTDLCGEIRHKLVDVISKNGGHLSSNLGVVELTVALYSVFNDDNDRIIWDVSHQSYAHKMLTGRFNKIDTIRTESGLSGFTNRKESKYDVFTQGHSSASISAALGLAYSKNITNSPGYVIAVIGDGALSGGLAYEGLNNAGQLKRNFILVLNDNKMSISKNVGAVARYLASARIRPSYVKIKGTVGKILNKGILGEKIKYLLNGSKSAIKNIIYKTDIKDDTIKGNVFEKLGFAYYGPVDGHNLEELRKAFATAKLFNKPVVVHAITTKGKGYKFAEKNSKDYHCISSFDVETGEKTLKNNLKTFSQEFGDAVCDLAEENSKVCAITAAMAEGTCLQKFKSKFKSRFFDVGIAEEHAVTFAGGLASGGIIPIFAVYSTFLQRSYDQILHDAALQNLNIILAIDRAGFVGEDGETHQGVFDVSFLNTIPNVRIFSPSFLEEISPMLRKATEFQGVSALRYPKGYEGIKPSWFKYTGNDYDFYGNINSKMLLVSYGRVFSNVCAADNRMADIGRNSCILKLNVIKPLNDKMISQAMNFNKIMFFEESVKSGSVSEKFGCALAEKGFKGKYTVTAIEDEFIPHATVKSQLKRAHLDIDNIVRKIMFM